MNNQQNETLYEETMILYPYNPEWRQWFNDLQEALSSGISMSNITFHHVGSTSIPGLIAKPIIDIDIEIPNYDNFQTICMDLDKLGYTNNGDQGIQNRIAFKQRDDEVPYCSPKKKWINHHLYVCPSFSEELHRHIAFRNYLQGDVQAKDEYARIKREVEKEANDDRTIYASLKEIRAKEFVEKIIKKACV
jgi:GrpB-like predicted nucleotidyltransferase (UPF0157 family)